MLEGHPIFTLSGHSGPINSVNFSMDGESFASAGEDKLVKFSVHTMFFVVNLYVFVIKWKWFLGIFMENQFYQIC